MQPLMGSVKSANKTVLCYKYYDGVMLYKININKIKELIMIKSMKSAFVLAITLSASLSSFNANAYEVYVHGQNCMAANVNQGKEFLWNRSGVTNVGTRPLYLVCNIGLDQDVLASFATPRVSVYVVEHMAGSNDSADCIARIVQASDGGASAIPTHTVIDSATINNINSFKPTGDSDAGIAVLDASAGSHVSAHLLCLLQPGSTIQSAGARIYD